MFTNQNNLKNHTFFMNLALAEAKKNLGKTKENPSVGCVITKNNSVIGIGSTSIGGRPHAEHNAINFSKKIVKGSKIYVTLEPCSHYGVTQPCTNLIIRNKLKQVLFSIKDPDFRSYNKSKQIFKNKKVHVINGICSSLTNDFYRSYFKLKNNLLPFISIKIAVSKDYYSINKRKKWITNNYSRARGHLLRSYHDCILTTSNTIIADNPRLTCRISGLSHKSPARIIFDNKLRVPLKSKVIKESLKYRTIIFFNKSNIRKIKLLKKKGIETYKISNDEEGNLDLKVAMLKARDLGFNRILIESGMTLINNFLINNLADDFNLFISNKNLGKNGQCNIKKKIKFFLGKKNKINERVNLFGDKLINYKIN